MDVGIFVPIGNNGWLISTTSPQYKPSFDLNRDIVERAEKYGFNFALSMIKLRGFGGPSEYWDHNLESFTLMAGLAAVTQRIKLYASVAVLTIPPAIVARMAVTIDSISHGRFGVNLVTGWQKAEYDQMGLWPGEAHFTRRYDYLAEYVTVLRDLWTTGHSDFKGHFFTMNDCRLSPLPQTPIELVCAGQSDKGMAFASEFTDYNFCGGGDWINTPLASTQNIGRLNEASQRSGRTVGAYMLLMIIADETDEAAMAKWQHYVAGTDHEALQWQASQAGADTKATENSTAGRLRHVADDRATAIPTRMSRLIGSYASVARMLDELATVEGLSGVMLTFDDFIVGIEHFGQRIQPLMRSRKDIAGLPQTLPKDSRPLATSL